MATAYFATIRWPSAVTDRRRRCPHATAVGADLEIANPVPACYGEVEGHRRGHRRDRRETSERGGALAGPERCSSSADRHRPRRRSGSPPDRGAHPSSGVPGEWQLFAARV